MSRRRWLLAGGLALLVAAVLGAGLWWRTTRDAPARDSSGASADGAAAEESSASLRGGAAPRPAEPGAAGERTPRSGDPPARGPRTVHVVGDVRGPAGVPAGTVLSVTRVRGAIESILHRGEVPPDGRIDVSFRERAPAPDDNDDWVFVVSAPGWAVIEQTLEVAHDGLVTIDLRWRDGPPSRGRVLYPAGTPVTGLRLRVRTDWVDAETAAWRHEPEAPLDAWAEDGTAIVVTDAEGRFEVRGLDEPIRGGESLDRRFVVHLDGGWEPREDGVVFLAGRAAGVVLEPVDEKGNPLAELKVSAAFVMRAGDRLVCQGNASADHGLVWILAPPLGDVPEALTVETQLMAANREPVSYRARLVSAEGVRRERVVMRRASWRSVKVPAAPWRALGFAGVIAVSRLVETGPTRTKAEIWSVSDSGDAFLFDLPPGRQRLRFADEYWDIYSVEVDLDVSAGDAALVVDPKLPPAGRIRIVWPGLEPGHSMSGPDFALENGDGMRTWWRRLWIPSEGVPFGPIPVGAWTLIETMPDSGVSRRHAFEVREGQETEVRLEGAWHR